MDKTTFSSSPDNKIQKCPYCRSSHLHSKGIIKKYRLVDEYILFNTYDDLPERKLLDIDYYINNFLKSGIPELVKFGKLLTR